MYGFDGSPEQSASPTGQVGGGAVHCEGSYPANEAIHSLAYGHCFVPHNSGEEIMPHEAGMGAWQQSTSMSNPAASARHLLL